MTTRWIWLIGAALTFGLLACDGDTGEQRPEPAPVEPGEPEPRPDDTADTGLERDMGRPPAPDAAVRLDAQPPDEGVGDAAAFDRGAADSALPDGGAPDSALDAQHLDASPPDASPDMDPPDPLSTEYCDCIFLWCHDLYHEVWGEDEGIARARCFQVAASLPRAGEPVEEGNSIECRIHWCDVVFELDDESLCGRVAGFEVCR